MNTLIHIAQAVFVGTIGALFAALIFHMSKKDENI
jgi:hypothetical protein